MSKEELNAEKLKIKGELAENSEQRKAIKKRLAAIETLGADPDEKKPAA